VRAATVIGMAHARHAGGIATVVVGLLLLCGASSPTWLSRTTPIVVHVEQGGFRWSDAGIGALAGVGIALLVCGSLALARPRNPGAVSSTKEEER
jgi:hypothetical protein